MALKTATDNIKNYFSDNVIVLIGIIMLFPIFETSFKNTTSLIIPIIFIPIVYVILFVLSFKFIAHISTPGLLVVNALYFLRYYILPITTINYMSDSYIQEYVPGTWLMLYEEIFLSVVLYVYLKKEKYSKITKIDDVKFNKEFKLVLLVFLVLCMACLLFFVIDSSVYSSFNLITNVGNDFVEMIEEQASKTESSSFRTLQSMIIYITYLLFAVCLVLFFYSKYRKNHSNTYFLLAFIIPLVASSIIIIDTDRGGIVHRCAAILFLLFRLFPEKRRTLINTAYLPIGLLVLYLVVSRMIDNDMGESVSSEEFFVYYMQSYLAGIQNCTDALRTYAHYGNSVDFATLFNDLFSNVPIMSHFTNNNACLKYFAKELLRDDQVLPLLGNGLMYFGYLFSPILLLLTIKLFVFIERKYMYESNILGIYVYSYSSIQLAFCHYQNIQLIMLYLSCRILPLWLVYKSVRYFSSK